MLTINYTGRIFVCRSLIENYVEEWSESYTLNRIYYESAFDDNLMNMCDDNMLLLHDNNNTTKYVDKKAFVLITRFMPINLN